MSDSSGESCAGEDVGRVWTDFFPFVEGSFRDVVDGTVSWEFVDGVGQAMRRALDAIEVSKEKFYGSAEVLSLTHALVVALLRVDVVLAMRADIDTTSLAGRDELVADIQEYWMRCATANSLTVCTASSSARVHLNDMCEEMWPVAVVVSGMSVFGVSTYHCVLQDSVRVVHVGGLYVLARAGCLVGDVIAEGRGGWPLLSVPVYRLVLRELKRVTESVDSGQSVLELLRAGVGFGVLADGVQYSVDMVCDYVWWLYTHASCPAGYCYARLFPVVSSRVECIRLGSYPQVDGVRARLVALGVDWCGVEATVDEAGGRLHVATRGGLPSRYMSAVGFVVGGPLPLAGETRVDLYTRAVVDKFLERIVAPPAQVTTPGTRAGSFLDGGCEGGLAEIARGLHAGIGQLASPVTAQRPSQASLLADSALGGPSPVVRAVDSRTADLQERLASGAVIDESYFDNAWRRQFRHWGRRSRLQVPKVTGRSVHLFDTAQAPSGVHSHVWVLDARWDVPGWTSYVAEFGPGDNVEVAFSAVGHEGDVRMDCTGEGVLDAGAARMPISGMLVWFTASLSARVQAKSYVTLRVSVPTAELAQPASQDMVRLVSVPGTVCIVRDFGVPDRYDTCEVIMRATGESGTSGVVRYTAVLSLPVGRPRLRLRGLRARVPVRVVLAATAVRDLPYLEWEGINFYPVQRDHLALCMDAASAVLSLRVKHSTQVKVSAIQVVNAAIFDEHVRQGVEVDSGVG